MDAVSSGRSSTIVGTGKPGIDFGNFFQIAVANVNLKRELIAKEKLRSLTLPVVFKPFVPHAVTDQ